MGNTEKLTFSSQGRRYAETTTFHGPSHVVEAWSVLEKIIWLLLMAVLFVTAAWQSYGLVMEYLESKTVTSVTNRVGKRNEALLNLTFCPEDWLDVSLVQPSQILPLIHALLFLPMVDFYTIHQLANQNKQGCTKDNETSVCHLAICNASKFIEDDESLDSAGVLAFTSLEKRDMDAALIQLMQETQVGTVQELLFLFTKNISVEWKQTKLPPMEKVLRAGRVCFVTKPHHTVDNKISFFFFHRHLQPNYMPGYAFTLYSTDDYSYPFADSNSFIIVKGEKYTHVDDKFGFYEAGVIRDRYQLSIEQYNLLTTEENNCTDDVYETYSGLPYQTALDSCVFRGLMGLLNKEIAFFQSNFDFIRKSILSNSPIDATILKNAALFDSETFKKKCNYNEKVFIRYAEAQIPHQQYRRSLCEGVTPKPCTNNNIFTINSIAPTDARSSSPYIEEMNNDRIEDENIYYSCWEQTDPNCSIYRDITLKINSFMVYEESWKMSRYQMFGSAGGIFGLYLGASLMSVAHLFIYWCRSICRFPMSQTENFHVYQQESEMK